jgi:hypothetical protein
MYSAEEFEFFKKRICDAVKKRNYSTLEPILDEIFLKKNKLTYLANLADQLPGMAFETFFLSGLQHLNELSYNDYKKLFALLEEKEIGMYQVTRFLIIHGGARKKTLQELCANFSKIQSIDQFQYYMDEDAVLPQNETKMNQLIYRDLHVSIENIAVLKKKFSTHS